MNISSHKLLYNIFYNVLCLPLNEYIGRKESHKKKQTVNKDNLQYSLILLGKFCKSFLFTLD